MGDTTMQKAVVLLLLLKKRIVTSAIHEFSINKAAIIAEVSPNTIKRYLPIWEGMGMVDYQGVNSDILVMKKISSSTKHRNYAIDRLDFSSFKRLYNSYREFLFLVIQSRKDYVKRLLRIAHDPRRGEDFKGARKACRQYAKTKAGEKTAIYHEYGLSYKKIARKIGVCVKTAQKIVSGTIKKRWCCKQRNFISFLLPSVNKMEIDGYTFTTHNYGYIILANTYTVSRSWGMALNRR